MRYVRDESMVPIAVGGSNDSGVRWTWLGNQDVHRMGVKQPTAGRDIVSGDRSPSGSMDGWRLFSPCVRCEIDRERTISAATRPTVSLWRPYRPASDPHGRGLACKPTSHNRRDVLPRSSSAA
jgi:hypothetical protein